MFFDSWQGIARVVAVGALSYVALIVWLRLSGKRTLSKWNAFDFVVTIALGSTLATLFLSKDMALAEGIAAFGVLIGLQFVITWFSVRWTWVRRLVKSEPTLLLDKGVFPSPDGDVTANPPGFDRGAFLKQLADEITDFFDKAFR